MLKPVLLTLQVFAGRDDFGRPGDEQTTKGDRLFHKKGQTTKNDRLSYTGWHRYATERLRRLLSPCSVKV
jgi:hypothetical protein